MRTLALASCLTFLVLAGCSQDLQLSPTAAGSPPFDLGPLPTDSRSASDVYVINGADYDAAGPGALASVTTLQLDATGFPFTWVRYVASVPASMPPNSLEVHFTTPPAECWLALGDYGVSGKWTWFGPYSADIALDFGADSARYISPFDNFYWVIAVGSGNQVSIESSTVDFGSGGGSLEIPPAGMQTVASGTQHNPSLTLMPTGAPVIAFTKTVGSDEKLFLATYRGGGWQLDPLLPADTFVRPQAKWLPDQNAGIVCAYDTTQDKLIALNFDADWAYTGAADIAPGPGKPFSTSSLDVDPATGELGLAFGFADDADNTGALYYSWTEGGVWNTEPVLYTGERVAGIAFKFDPAGGDPWMFYTHGTIDKTELILMNYALEMGRQTAGTWSFAPVDYTDPTGNTSPLLLDLKFDGNNPQLAMTVGRDFTSLIPGLDFVATLMLDGVVGSYDGTWNWAKVFNSPDPDISLEQFPPTKVTVGLSECSEIHQPMVGDAQFPRVEGYIDFNTSLTPIGGEFNTFMVYKRNNGGSWDILDPPYFDGDPGRAFSWDGTSAPSCAYIDSPTVDYQKVLSGDWQPSGALLYWSPPAG